MNKKRLAEHLEKKLKDFVKSIEDKKVKQLVHSNSIITGGSIVSLLLGEKVTDYDIYFRNKETVLAVARYYVDIFNKDTESRKNRFDYHHKAIVIEGGEPEFIQEQIEKQGERVWRSAMLEDIPEGRVKIVVRSDGAAENTEYKPDPETLLTDMDDIDYEADLHTETEENKKEPKKYHPRFLTSNAVTLSNRIQCVVRFYGAPDEIHTNYDYTHCTNYWTLYEGLTLKKDALETILDKRLVYQGSKYPLSSIIRMRKFLNKGWKINAGQILKMCFQLSELDLADPKVLEEQLIGVDTMYFFDLIEMLKAHKEKDPEFVPNTKYITTLVDKIFG